LSTRKDLVDEHLVETEAEQCVSHAYRVGTGEELTRMDIYSHASHPFPLKSGEELIRVALGRAEGKLLQHLFGTQYFYDHEYEVGPDVLVPRPETELLVSFAIEEIEKNASTPELGVEVGLGCGAISIELLARFSSLKMVGSELTPEARRRALTNARNILGEGDANAGRLVAVQAGEALDVLGCLKNSLGDRRADFLISNPPYLVPGSDEVTAEVHAYEPHTALYAPPHDPVFFYREIAKGAEELLKPGGKVFVEIPHERTRDVRQCFVDSGWEVTVQLDLAGRDRILIARKRAKRG
jgi:release factor glutamine methyltransferase